MSDKRKRKTDALVSVVVGDTTVQPSANTSPGRRTARPTGRRHCDHASAYHSRLIYPSSAWLVERWSAASSTTTSSPA